MNCKKGDLAVIVRVEGEWEQPDLGRLVDVLGPGDDWSDEGDPRFHWAIRAVDGKPLRFMDPDGSMGVVLVAHCPDDALRPIRDPGDDATDETLEWLPVPSAHNLKEAA